MTARNGDTLRVDRKDCKGDPEFTLSDSEMHVKAANLMQYGGLSDADSRSLCDEILSLPAGNSTPALFNDFIEAIGLTG